MDDRDYFDLLDLPVADYTDSELIMMIGQRSRLTPERENKLYDELYRRAEINVDDYYDDSVGYFAYDVAANYAAAVLGFELNI